VNVCKSLNLFFCELYNDLWAVAGKIPFQVYLLDFLMFILLVSRTVSNRQLKTFLFHCNICLLFKMLCRFKEVLQRLFNNRVSIRKELLELEGSEKVLALKIIKKEMTLSRLSVLVNESDHDKVNTCSRVDLLWHMLAVMNIVLTCING
jgi:hypothetical protein